MSRIVSLTCLLAACLGISAAAAAAVTAATKVPAAAAVRPLPLDPRLADAQWQLGSVPGSFMDLTTRTAAPLATSVWMLYDSTNLYVAVRAQQRGVPITATQSTNDVGFGVDDYFGVGIDTSANGADAYYFEVTPRGVRYQQANENARYRPKWNAAAIASNGEWSAVMIVPLHALRIHGGSPQTWRINFVRNVAAQAEHYTWAYDGLMDNGGGDWPNFRDVRYWAQWTGIQVDRRMLQSARPKPRAEVYALQSAGSDREIFAQANGTFQRRQVRPAGVDFSYPLTSTINFVGTLAPDFSNVEIDQQTIAPQEFRRRLQEYRPFFTQGADFINANPVLSGPNVLFYSPSIGPFDRGAKVEGTYGRQSFGVLNVRGYDETSGDEFDDTAYGFRHALQDRTFIYWADGVLAHHSAFGSDATNEAGFVVRNLRTGFVGGFDGAVEDGSWVPQRYASNTSGFIDFHKPNWEINVGETDISPNFNPINGFTANSDVRGLNFFADTSAATRGVKNFNAFVSADRYFDRSGAVHQADFNLSIGATFKNGFSLDGIGPNVSELRNYALDNPNAASTTCSDPALPRASFTGYPGYYCGRTDTFNLFTLPVGYGDGTATPIDASVNFGRFGYGMLGPSDNGADYVHLYTFSFSRPLARVLSIGFEWDGTYERATTSALADAQFLRRLSLGANLGNDANVTLSLRSINGYGGFAVPGTNVAGAYHRRLRSGDDLFVNFGTPAASSTLNRFIVKYVFRFGGDAGT